MAVAALHALVTAKALPFSEVFVAGRQAGRTGTTLLLMFASLPMCGVHALLSFVPGAVAVMSVVVLLIAARLLKRYAGTNWREVALVRDA